MNAQYLEGFNARKAGKTQRDNPYCDRFEFSKWQNWHIGNYNGISCTGETK